MQFRCYVKIALVLLSVCYVFEGNAQKYKITSDKFEVAKMDSQYNVIENSSKAYKQSSVIDIDIAQISVTHPNGIDRYVVTQNRQTVHGLEMVAQDKQGNTHSFQLNLSNKVVLQVDFSRSKVIGYNIFKYEDIKQLQGNTSSAAGEKLQGVRANEIGTAEKQPYRLPKLDNRQISQMISENRANRTAFEAYNPFKENADFGRSKYDYDVQSRDDVEDLEQFRADQQAQLNHKIMSAVGLAMVCILGVFAMFRSYARSNRKRDLEEE